MLASFAQHALAAGNRAHTSCALSMHCVPLDTGEGHYSGGDPIARCSVSTFEAQYRPTILSFLGDGRPGRPGPPPPMRCLIRTVFAARDRPGAAVERVAPEAAQSFSTCPHEPRFHVLIHSFTAARSLLALGLQHQDMDFILTLLDPPLQLRPRAKCGPCRPVRLVVAARSPSTSPILETFATAGEVALTASTTSSYPSLDSHRRFVDLGERDRAPGCFRTPGCGRSGARRRIRNSPPPSSCLTLPRARAERTCPFPSRSATMFLGNAGRGVPDESPVERITGGSNRCLG